MNSSSSKIIRQAEQPNFIVFEFSSMELLLGFEHAAANEHWGRIQKARHPMRASSF
jgi:hypothetical protein